jgi:homocysteine S-methyltransferase
MQDFKRRLRSGRPLVLDGGLATEIEAQGARLSSQLWSAALLHSAPERISAAHQAYLKAGAEVLISASYQGSREGFASLGLDAQQSDHLLHRSVALAREAAQLAGRPDVFIAASVGPYGATQHDGSEYTGVYNISTPDLHAFHQLRLATLDQAGADILACETIPNFAEAQVLARLLHGTSTPAWVSFCCRDGHRLSDGLSLRKAAALFEQHPGVLALGINCTAPQHLSSLITELKAAAPSLPVLVYPNSGEHYDAGTGDWSGLNTPLELAQAAQDWILQGASAVGGCCRMGPEHIRAIAQAMQPETGENL